PYLAALRFVRPPHLLPCFSIYGSADLRDLHSFPTRRSSDLGQPFPTVIHNCIDKRMLIMSRRRMDDHSLRLIDHKDVIVFIKDIDRKSTRLNSSHVSISYAVFCLKKKTQHHRTSLIDKHTHY